MAIMFQELDTITLATPIPIKNTRDIPDYSPLLKDGSTEGGLIPGDVGVIVYVQGGGECFEVEFLMPEGYTVAIATVYPEQMRPAEDGYRENYRFGGKWSTSPPALRSQPQVILDAIKVQLSVVQRRRLCAPGQAQVHVVGGHHHRAAGLRPFSQKRS